MSRTHGTPKSHALNNKPATVMLSHTWLDHHAANGKCLRAAIAVVRRDGSRVQPSFSSAFPPGGSSLGVPWGWRGWRVHVSTRNLPSAYLVGL